MMWDVWKMAKAYSCRPSELLGITNSAGAYHADRATMYFCTELEVALSEVDGRKMSEPVKNLERKKLLDKWLKLEPAKTGGASGYRDPAMKFTG